MLTAIKSVDDLLDRWELGGRAEGGTIRLRDILAAHVDTAGAVSLVGGGGKEISSRRLAELRLDGRGWLVYPIMGEGYLARLSVYGVVFTPSIDEQERLETARDYIAALADNGVDLGQLAIASGIARGILRNIYLRRAKRVAWDILAQLYQAGTLLDLIAGRVPR
jgi:hypothetical protein